MDVSKAFDTKKSPVIISKIAYLWIRQTGFSYDMWLFVKPKASKGQSCF